METDGIYGVRFHQAIYEDDDLVNKGPDDQSSTSDTLHHTQHHLSHEATVYTTESKAEEVDDCKCNFALRGGIISAQIKLILELLVQLVLNTRLGLTFMLLLERGKGGAAPQCVLLLRALYRLGTQSGSMAMQGQGDAQQALQRHARVMGPR